MLGKISISFDARCVFISDLLSLSYTSLLYIHIYVHIDARSTFHFVYEDTEGDLAYWLCCTVKPQHPTSFVGVGRKRLPRRAIRTPVDALRPPGGSSQHWLCEGRRRASRRIRKCRSRPVATNTSHAAQTASPDFQFLLATAIFGSAIEQINQQKSWYDRRGTLMLTSPQTPGGLTFALEICGCTSRSSKCPMLAGAAPRSNAPIRWP